jgi:hypothetical protein
MIDPTLIQLTRVIYEERVNEYKLHRVGVAESALSLAFAAIKNALFSNKSGRNGATTTSGKGTKLATR